MGTVRVEGLTDSERLSLSGRGLSSQQWAELLSIRVARDPGQPEAAPIVGRHEVVGRAIQFTPRYPFLTGTRYQARFDPRRLDEALSNVAPIELAMSKPSKPPGKPTEVVAIYPTNDVLPENQLKFYVEFSAPMSRGEAYRRVRLLDGSGRPVDRPFLELGEELWNPEMTRLTLLFDPGRLKRGLKPREEEGPILEQGKRYSFVIDCAWLDANGHPLANEARKSFNVSAPDEVQPDVKRWTFNRPRISSRDPLVAWFPEPLDYAMLNRAIRVQIDSGNFMSGHMMIGDRERSWRFTPNEPWVAGLISLTVDPELEDLAGNSLERPFEVDLTRPVSTPIKIRVIVPGER